MNHPEHPKESPKYVKDLQVNTQPNPQNPRVLVILHGPLRLFLQAQGALAAIRRQHRDQEIILLTSQPFKQLALMCPYVNKVWIDPLPEWYNYKGWIQIYKQYKHLNIDMVYDLMCNERTTLYFKLAGRKKPKWNGHISWCSHPYTDPNQWSLHNADRFAEQLAITDIVRTPKPDINWINGDVSNTPIPRPFALLVAGGSMQSSINRWHAYGFADLANWLWTQHGITPVFIGTERDIPTVNTIISGCHDCQPLNLIGKTDLTQIPPIARAATLTVGNDSGPLHMAAMSRCPTLMLAASNGRTDLEAPQVNNLLILEEYDLNQLEILQVTEALKQLIPLDSEQKTAKQADSQPNQDVINDSHAESTSATQPDNHHSS